MKDKPADGHGTAAGPQAALRRQAEKIARERKGTEVENPATLPPGAAQRVLHDLQVHQIELELQNEELRRSQDALEDSRARYFDLYNLAPVGYFTLDGNGIILEANLTGATMLGVARGTLVKQPFSRFVAGDNADDFYLHHRQLMSKGTPQAFELRLSRQGGAPFTAWIDAAAVPSNGGAPACRVVISDITERKEVEAARARLAAIVEFSDDAIIGMDLGGIMTSWNAGAERIFGYTAQEAVGQSVTLLIPKQRLAEAAVILEKLRRGEATVHCETVRCRKDGTSFDVSLTASPVLDQQGRVVGASQIARDITERKKAEQARASLEAQLRESQKMEAIGTLAGGIAHDFNNILATILGNAELARQDAGANWKALVSLDEIQKAGYRARDLVQQILAFSRRQPTSRRVMSLPAIVEESVRLLRAALPGAVRIECHCAADTPAVLADPTQLQQVLLNLGTNAAHAMEGRSGRIDILVEGITQDEASARVDLNLRPGRYARVVIIDTGHGMDAATLRRIFEPFFTTKPPGKGTGLGLSVAHGIMQAHEGAIVAHSEPGKGSSFELYFPRAQTVADTLAQTEVANPASEGRGQHILYIDDDEAQLFLIKRTLERWGYRVSAYLEQREALDALLAGAEHFDLVLTDFKMPGMSGLEVARAIHDAQPELPVVVVSGYITEALRAQASAAGVRELIFKAQEMEELRDVVQRLVPPPKTILRRPGQ